MNKLAYTPLLLVLLTPGFALAEKGGCGNGKMGHFERMFEDADADGNGILSKQEVLNAHTAKVEKRFAKMDKNGDGNLEKSEIEQSIKERRELRREFRKKLGEAE